MAEGGAGRQELELEEEILAHLKTNIVDTEASSRVAAFYTHRSVFITGGTGFIGKILVEKLLRSCPDIKRIYLLIRDTRDGTACERLERLKETQIFSRIRSQPGGRQMLDEKLRATRGNMTSPGLGVSEVDLGELSREVSLVFNLAATIRFNAPVDIAVRENVQSVGEMAKFCDQLASLEAIVHLSTAYSNCHKRDTIYEAIYDPPMQGDRIIELVRLLTEIQDNIHAYPRTVGATGADHQDEEASSEEESSKVSIQHNFYEQNTANANRQTTNQSLLNELTKIILRMSNRPNTYTLTKAISESYLMDLLRKRPDRYMGDKIQVSIVRPSIVTGAWREPIAGFMDNTNGCTGALLFISLGILHAFPVLPDRVADLVPVDMVSNTLICAGCFLVEQKTMKKKYRLRQPAESYLSSEAASAIKMNGGIYLFNVVSGRRNPICWYPLISEVVKLANKYPAETLARVPSFICMSPGILYELFDLIGHKLPALLADLFKAWILREQKSDRTSSLAVYSKIKQLSTTLTPFSSRQWRFSDSNTRSLYESLSEPDKRLFPFDVVQIYWPDYIRRYMISARRFVLHEQFSGVRNGRRKLNRLLMAYRTSLTMLLVAFYYFFFHQSRLESTLASVFQ